jgi:hypothetical protein
MLRYSRLLFKTKYRAPLKDATSIGSMLFSMSWMEPVPMTRLASTETLREQLNIGLTGSFLRDSPVCWMETILDAQPDCLLKTCINCAKISVVLPENWDITKTCGMDCCFLTILLRNTPYRLVSGNAREFSINSVSVSRDPAEKPAKLMPYSRKPLKKLLSVNARPYRSTLVRRRSPFSTPQQFGKNVGTQRTTTSYTFAFGPSQSGFLRGTQFENRSACDSASPYLQCSDFRRLYSLSAPIYSRQNLSDSGQCQMAQIQRSQTLLRGESASIGIRFSASLFSRTQSNRASLEDHSSNGNSQPLFPFDRRPPYGSGIPIYGLDFTKLVS